MVLDMAMAMHRVYTSMPISFLILILISHFSLLLSSHLTQPHHRYLLENINCGYQDHFGQWNAAFAGHSYARIRELHTGNVVANISETIDFAFMYVLEYLSILAV